MRAAAAEFVPRWLLNANNSSKETSPSASASNVKKKSVSFSPASDPTGPAPAPLCLPPALDVLKPARIKYSREFLLDRRVAVVHSVATRQLYTVALAHDLIRRLGPGHEAVGDNALEQVSQEERDIEASSCLQCCGQWDLYHQGVIGRPHPNAWLQPPCAQIAGVLEGVVTEERSRNGAFLLQTADVITALLKLTAAFERGPLVTLPQNSTSLIKSFLCGEGYHCIPPHPNEHQAWHSLIRRLRFDAIRDNTTPIYTDSTISKAWRQKFDQSPFRQFCYFWFFRTDVPPHKVKSMLTHAHKPMVVACACGDVSAAVLLGRLGFAVLPDAHWEALSFYNELVEPRRRALLRHLCLYLLRKQLQNPAPIMRLTMNLEPEGGHPTGKEHHLFEKALHMSPQLTPVSDVKTPPMLSSSCKGETHSSWKAAIAHQKSTQEKKNVQKIIVSTPKVSPKQMSSTAKPEQGQKGGKKR